MNIDDIELHDALLKGMYVDYPSKRIRIAIDYYETADSPQRAEAMREFEGIESITQITDLERLEKNAFFDNVNYRVPKATDGTTFIYLTDGCISVKATMFYQACLMMPTSNARPTRRSRGTGQKAAGPST